MSMDKRFLLVGLILVFFMASAFAVTQNSIQHFNLSWNPNTNQLNIGVQCEGQTMGTLVLGSGQTRDIICGTMDFGQTWMIGEIENTNQLTGIFTIPESCEICSMASTVNTNDPDDQTDLFLTQVLFAIIMIVVILFILFVVNKLNH